MNYRPCYPSAFPPLGDLSLNAFEPSENPWLSSCVQQNDASQSTSYPSLIHDQCSPGENPPQWSMPMFDSGVPPAPYAHSPASSPWPACGTDSFPTQYMCIPELAFPPSPSDTCSSVSADISPSLRPGSVHVVCNAPLVAPIPLPYHSPTFLQFDLPDIDEDLSHPPYTRRPAKRKYDGDGAGRVSSKHRLSDMRPSSPSQWHSVSHRSHHMGVKRIRPRRSIC